MKIYTSLFLKRFLEILTIISFGAIVYLLIIAGKRGSENLSQLYIDKKLACEEQAYKELQFNLVDPAEAPESIQEMARLGFQAMIETKKNAPEYVGNRLSCTACHFAGGNTTGGSQGGFSLAGVATKYPIFDKNLGKVIDLSTRINNCFLRSMNGKALPLDSKLMLAFITYFHWISKNLPIYQEVPWLKNSPLNSTHQGSPEQGKHLFDTYCAICHKEEFLGEIYPPPVWGEGSFNDGAGMNKIPKLATFIYWNMPYNEVTPILTEEEALDVAAYIVSKPRPHYAPNSR